MLECPAPPLVPAANASYTLPGLLIRTTTISVRVERLLGHGCPRQYCMYAAAIEVIKPALIGRAWIVTLGVVGCVCGGCV